METTRTAAEVIRNAYEKGYGGRLASSPKGDAIAYWTGERWYMCASLTIAGQWVDMDNEIWINGHPPFEQDQWAEHSPPNLLDEIHERANAAIAKATTN